MLHGIYARTERVVAAYVDYGLEADKRFVIYIRAKLKDVKSLYVYGIKKQIVVFDERPVLHRLVCHGVKKFLRYAAAILVELRIFLILRVDKLFERHNFFGVRSAAPERITRRIARNEKAVTRFVKRVFKSPRITSVRSI